MKTLFLTIAVAWFAFSSLIALIQGEYIIAFNAIVFAIGIVVASLDKLWAVCVAGVITISGVCSAMSYTPPEKPYINYAFDIMQSDQDFGDAGKKVEDSCALQSHIEMSDKTIEAIKAVYYNAVMSGADFVLNQFSPPKPNLCLEAVEAFKKAHPDFLFSKTSTYRHSNKDARL